MTENDVHSADDISKRKNDHIRINLNEDIHSRVDVGFDSYYFQHNALPEISLASINIGRNFLGKQISAPLLISSMTGGTEEGDKINARLAETAEDVGIPMGVGSQRIEIQSGNSKNSISIRKYAPSIPLYANIGAVQLNYGLTLDDCKRAIELIQGDALILHLNPLQEALQPEGQTNFVGLLTEIEKICKSIEIPVIVKEVGWGISIDVARKLINAGVTCIDVAGAGGTSWAMVEKFRNTSQNCIDISDHFKDWGIPTADCVSQIHKEYPTTPLIASGGIKRGIDIAKSIALGANITGVAGVLFRAAAISTESIVDKVNEFIEELRITMFVVGAKDLTSLSRIPLYKNNGK